MLAGMNMADPEMVGATDAAPAEAPPGPSQIAPPADAAVPHGCPFLVAESGGWRLDVPTREHRCSAVSPPAALSLEKQARLCLTVAHEGCATYLASMEARGARIGAAPNERTTRWAYARTTTVIEDSGGVRSRVVGLLLDRGRWPAIPAVILVVTLLVLAVSGLRGVGNVAVATASPSHAATAAPTSAPTTAPTDTPKPVATPTAVPSVAPSRTPAPTAKPKPTFQTYVVKSGDSLSAIAARFGTTSKAIADLNGIAITSTIHPGQVLKIPNA